MNSDKQYPFAAWAAALHGDLQHAGMTSDDILAQEADGAKRLRENTDLPTDGLLKHQEALEKAGFKIGNQVDDLFTSVEMPEGWKKVSSDRDPRHMELQDASGNCRATIFYKAAFYDRNASINFCGPLSVNLICEDGLGYYEKSREGAVQAKCVLKHKDKIVFQTEMSSIENAYGDEAREMRSACEAYMEEHYPEHGNPFAYWE